MANYLPFVSRLFSILFFQMSGYQTIEGILNDRSLPGVRCGEMIMSYFTQRKQAEPIFKRNDDNYRLLVEQVIDYSIFMLDETGHIISWNKGAEKMKGYTKNEIIGRHFSMFYPEKEIAAQKPQEELKQAVRLGRYENEGWRVRKDGSTFWANAIITPVYNENRKLIGFSRITRDLTEKKVAEEALKESEERYRQLADKLNKINAELGSVNQELEHFTSIVSHDLQEPLRTIHGFLQLIEMRLADTAEPEAGNRLGTSSYEELKTYISKAIRRGDQMKNLIISLLRYSQLTRGEIVFSEIRIHELLDEVLQNLKNSIDDTSAVITINSEPETVKGDKIQLIQLLQNLVGNAIKFRGDKTPEINIDIRAETDHYLFSVSDNGIGIPHEQLKNVFEIFRRMHDQKKYPGTGVGLAICKKIVERHAGRIWVESWTGKGTTFYFTISKQL